AREPRADGIAGHTPVPRHDDVRVAVRRGAVARPPRRGGGRRHHVPGHRRRRSARRLAREGGPDRGDRRSMVARSERPVRGRHEVRSVGRGRIRGTRARGLVRFESVQPRYNLLFREIERELLPLCAEEAIGVIPYNPLAGGLLSGKHDRGAAPAEGTRFTVGTAGAMYQQRYWHDASSTLSTRSGPSPPRPVSRWRRSP